MNIHWTKLTHLFPEERQCLASFIAWQAAEVVAKAKPANLINVIDRELPCGRNIHNLWVRHQKEIFVSGELKSVELRQKGDRLLVLIYHPDALSNVLQKYVVKKTLRNLGYHYDNLDEALSHLMCRMQDDDFPHEIGFFLGYPIKDVFGFMGLCDLPLVGNGPWKMYGKLETSVTTLKEHLAARKSVLDTLRSTLNPMLLLQKKRPVIQQAA